MRFSSHIETSDPVFVWGGGSVPPTRLCAQASGLARIRRAPLNTHHTTAHPDTPIYTHTPEPIHIQGRDGISEHGGIFEAAYDLRYGAY